MTLRPYQQNAFDCAVSWHKYKPEKPAIIDIATGGGKTHIIAALIEYYYNAGKTVCLLAHRKELLEQSGGKLDPLLPYGFYSASIGHKNLDAPIVIAGIQSIYNVTEKQFDVILVDECHRMSNRGDDDGDGMYWQFINNNKNAIIVGLTATPYRLKGGMLSWGDVVYSAPYPMLLKEGYLTKITNKAKKTPNLDGIKITAGEFNIGELETVMSDSELITEAVKNIKGYGDGRNSILIFCVSVNHARVLTEVMKANGLESAYISGETSQVQRKSILDDFKSGHLRHLINCEILLEGFDAPNIDMIVCLRPTKSKGLWEQMLGRGVRLFEGKDDCLLIDMAGNLMEHGALGTPYREPSKKEVKKKNGRICPECESFVSPVTATECPDCGYVFIREEPPKASHDKTADVESDTDFNPFYEYNVTGVTYGEHISKAKGTKSLRVNYHCPDAKYGTISEWLSPHHENDFVRGKAHQFFKKRGKDIYGDIGKYSMDDLIFFANQHLKRPVKITVDHSDKFPRITEYKYAEEKSGGSDTAGAGEVATDILRDDIIPF